MNLILFDYDDTLICSSHIARNNIFVPSRDMLSQLYPDFVTDSLVLERTAMEALKTAKSHGEVIIVTNAKLEWIEYSGQTYFPELLCFIANNNIPIISAQDLYGHEDPEHPLLWKVKSFRYVVAEYNNKLGRKPSNLISIGDGMHEKIACRMIADEMGIVGRCVQFIDSPVPNQITSQLKLTLSSMNDLFDFEKSERDFFCVHHDTGEIKFFSSPETLDSAPLIPTVPSPCLRSISIESVGDKTDMQCHFPLDEDLNLNDKEGLDSICLWPSAFGTL